MLSLTHRILKALEDRQREVVSSALQKQANPSLYDFGYVAGLNAGLNEAVQQILQQMKAEEDD